MSVVSKEIAKIVAENQRLERELKRVQFKYEQEMQSAEASQKRLEMELKISKEALESWERERGYWNEGVRDLKAQRDHWKAEAERMAKELAIERNTPNLQDGLAASIVEESARLREALEEIKGKTMGRESVRHLYLIASDALGEQKP